MSPSECSSTLTPPGPRWRRSTNHRSVAPIRTASSWVPDPHRDVPRAAAWALAALRRRLDGVGEDEGGGQVVDRFAPTAAAKAVTTMTAAGESRTCPGRSARATALCRGREASTRIPSRPRRRAGSSRCRRAADRDACSSTRRRVAATTPPSSSAQRQVQRRRDGEGPTATRMRPGAVAELRSTRPTSPRGHERRSRRKLPPVHDEQAAEQCDHGREGGRQETGTGWPR